MDVHGDGARDLRAARRVEVRVSDRTKLIAVGGASNAIGTINDLRRVVKIAKDAGALTFVDAVHLTPHELADVQSIGCDFLACSSYKFHGPHAPNVTARTSSCDPIPRAFRLGAAKTVA